MKYLRLPFVRVAIPLVLLASVIIFGKTAVMQAPRAFVADRAHSFFSFFRFGGELIGLSRAQLSANDAKALIEENQKLKSAAFAVESLQEENASLQKLLKIKAEKSFSAVHARVLMHQREFGVESIVIDQGKDAGVSEGDNVVDEHEFLLGTVTEADATSAKVEIATSQGLLWEAQFIPLQTKAAAKGIGDRTFALNFIPHDAVIHVGDVMSVVLHGTAFAAGQVARVHVSDGVTFQDVQATLLARPELTGFVTVFVSKK